MKHLFLAPLLALGLMTACGNGTPVKTNAVPAPTSEPVVASAPITSKPTLVRIETSEGNIDLELAADKAPITVNNFVNYVNKGHYNGTVFHRVIDGFMIQGGGMDAQLQEKPTDAPIENEANNGLKNEIGTIAMARTSAPNSATSQFFINVADNEFLNYQGSTPNGAGYAVFGHVSSGMDVVNKIAKTQTGNQGMHQDVPVKPIVIQKVTVLPNP